MAGGSKWRKLKLALGLNTCLYVPKTTDDGDCLPSPLSPAPSRSSDSRLRMPTTPNPSSSGLQLPKKHPKRTCAICLTTMKTTDGQAIFTAECSHSFHFHCITSNVRHGNRICPICRAKWKEIPFQNSGSSDPSRGRSRNSRGSWLHDDAWMVLQGLPPQRMDLNRNVSSLFQAPEPPIFNDDEPVKQKSVENPPSIDDSSDNSHAIGGLKVKMHPEISAVSKLTSHDNFAILIHLKAPVASGSLNSRAPVDLVTVLDVSGSMSGTKLALLKQAMGFVIQNLGPSDRLSVIAFSSTARRLFPLRRMTSSGKQECLQAINSLVANGGTNIAEALKRGAKVMADRRCKNAVSSIILLSDGQDTYTLTSPRRIGSRTDYQTSRTDYQTLLPSSMHLDKEDSGLHIPVHTFGFGMDHDATAMHSIAESSGGTFSFIEADNVIQDAFAQCIGGILSVVVQELHVEVECVHPMLRLGSIKAGSYKAGLVSDSKFGFIEVGDLYAEEERDFLVTMNIPVDESCNEMGLVKAKVIYKDPMRKEVVVNMEGNDAVIISRPEKITDNQSVVVSIEVDRQRNRLRAADAIAEARVAAERGDLTAAATVLENCRKQLSESVAARGGDQLCCGLLAELREMQERMANRRVYESSGRAYVLSGLSSHSWQRATARGDSTEFTSQTRTYQTPSMVDMVNLSQTMSFDAPLRRSLRSVQSFPPPQPR